MTPAPCGNYARKSAWRMEHALARLFKIDARPETGHEFVWIHRCESEGSFTLHPDEIETGGWFAPEKISQWMAERPQDFASALLLIWKRLRGDSPQ